MLNVNDSFHIRYKNQWHHVNVIKELYTELLAGGHTATLFTAITTDEPYRSQQFCVTMSCCSDGTIMFMDDWQGFQPYSFEEAIEYNFSEPDEIDFDWK